MRVPVVLFDIRNEVLSWGAQLAHPLPDANVEREYTSPNASIAALGDAAYVGQVRVRCCHCETPRKTRLTSAAGVDALGRQRTKAVPLHSV